MDALLELELPDVEGDADGAFEALVAVNHRWLGRYARLHPSFGVEPALLEHNSLWMNAFFQKSRMTTSAASPQAKSLIKKHRETVAERLRAAPLPHSESPFSTCVVDTMAALMHASSIDRCPHNNLVRTSLRPSVRRRLTPRLWCFHRRIYWQRPGNCCSVGRSGHTLSGRVRNESPLNRATLASG
jgi:hypothetical protein